MPPAPPAASAASTATAPADLVPSGNSGSDSDNLNSTRHRNIEAENHGFMPTELLPSEPPSEPPESSRLPTETLGLGAGNQNIAPVLHLLQRTHQDVMQQTLQMNDVRAPLSTGLTNFMQSLDKFMLGLTAFVESAGLSNDLSTQFNQLRNQDFRYLRDDQFTAFQTLDNQYGEHENALVQVLWRSSRYLDKLLDAHKNGPTDEALLRTLSSSQGQNDLTLEDTQYSPELLRFLSQTGDVEAIREKLVDLNFEREQILSDKEAREQFGLSLDEDSLTFLESFDLQNQTLLDELHAAEAILTSLRQYLTDEDIYKVSAEDTLQPHNQEEATLEEDNTPLDSTLHQVPRANDPNPTYPQLQQEPIQVWGYLDPSRPTPIDPTDFINAWQLHELQSSPHRWRVFSSVLETWPIPEVDAQELDHLIRITWFNDIPTAELAQRRRFADQQSMEQNEAESQHPLRRSATVVAHLPISLPLLKLNSMVTANDIMERARQAKERYSSQVELLGE